MAGSFDSGCARRWRRYDGVNKTQPQQEHKAMTLRPFVVLTTYLGIACIFGFLICQAWRSMGHRTGPLDHNGADSEIETLNAGDLFGDCKGPDEAGPAAPFAIDHDARCVVGRDGMMEWSTRLEGYLGLVRPPHLLFDKERVYVTHGDGVTALDVRTGVVLWHSPGPS